jgi:hypothetical protein
MKLHGKRSQYLKLPGKNNKMKKAMQNLINKSGQLNDRSSPGLKAVSSSNFSSPNMSRMSQNNSPSRSPSMVSNNKVNGRLGNKV